MGHTIHSLPMAQSPTSTAITIPIQARSRPEPHMEESLTTPHTLSSYPRTPPLNSRHHISPLHIPNHRPMQSSPSCEKGQPDLRKASAGHILPSNPLPSNSPYVQELSDSEDEEEDECDVDRQKEHAAFIFAYLSILAPLLATMITLYAIFILAVLLVISPLYIFSKRRSLRGTASYLLWPPVQLQLDLILSHCSSRNHASANNPVLLGVKHVVAPAFAVGIMVAAWVAGSFWAFAKILGNPDGHDERNDGRAAVLWVRRCWEKILVWGL